MDRLKRKYNNEEIVVTFDCQDENEESALNDDFDVDKYYNEDNVEGDATDPETTATDPDAEARCRTWR